MVLLISIAILGCLFLSGCNATYSENYQTVKMPPAMRYKATEVNYDYAINHSNTEQNTTPTNAILQSSPSMRGIRQDNATMLSRIDLMQELRTQGLLILPTVNDHKYVIPQHSWVNGDYSSYFDSYIYYLGAEYNAEGMDCDNFADFYRQNLVLANLKAGGARQGDVPCATIVVNQRDKGIYHALNLMRTNRGWFVIEPQDGTFTKLSSYQYLRNITKVTF